MKLCAKVVLALLLICIYISRYKSLDIPSIENLPQSERSALKELYDSTNGTYWNFRDVINHRGIVWNFTGDYYPCQDQWVGLDCSCQTGVPCHVVSIVLNLFNMSGVLPTSLNNFTELVVLDFISNQLYGQLPDLSNCTNLRSIDMQGNAFSGTIPQWILHNTGLQYVDLSFNSYSGSISPEISQMSSIQQLFISDNALTGTLPIELTEMTTLQNIALRNNQLAGTIPVEIGRMPNLNAIQFANNFFHGTIPGVLANITVLSYLDLGENYFTGTIPEEFIEFVDLKYLILSSNQLTGTVSGPLIAKLNTVKELYFNHNYFTGTLPIITNGNFLYYEFSNNAFTGAIPAELFAIEQLNYFDVSVNYLTGTMPDGMKMFNNVEFIDISSNYISGTIPSTITNLTYLIDLLMYNNMLTGTLPQGLNSMILLESFMLQNNFLHGNLSALINASAPLWFVDSHPEQEEHFNVSNYQVLSSIDVSNNRITGSIPPQIFVLPRLLTFAAVSNCISGDIPLSVCNATQMTALALDGLSTSTACHNRIFKGIPRLHAYLLSFSLQGGIPDCLYSLPSLNSLHLSGNGITGTIPNDVKLGPNLLDLTLSHNGIRGTIPLQIQQRVWTNLDLSYNKIGGVLDSTFGYCGPMNMIMLEVNRLSGQVPKNLTEGVELNILQGNIFECYLNKHSIPQADEDYANYECGSNSFYLSLAVWGLFAGVAVMLIGLAVLQYRGNVVWLSQFFVVQYLSHILSQCIVWMSEYNVHPFENFGLSNETNIFAFGLFCSDIRYKTFMTTLFLMFVVLPVYIALAVPYQTYTFMYAWTASAMFMSGMNAALGMLLILSLYLILVIYVGNSIVHAKYTKAKHAKAVETQEETRWESTKRKLGYFIGLSPAVLINCFAMIMVNVGYVYMTLHFDTVIVSVAQVVLASFKLAWNEFAVRKLLTMSVNFLENRAAAGVASSVGIGTAHLVDTSNFLRVIKEDIPFRTIILLFNNIFTPCIAIAIVSPVCFTNLFFNPPNVQTYYSLCLSALGSTSSGENRCKTKALTTFSTKYTPPFTYSYQCSSTFVQNYASMYVYMFLIVAFVMPVIYFMAKEVYLYTQNSTSTIGKYVFWWCNYFLPSLLKPLPVRLKDLLERKRKNNSNMKKALISSSAEEQEEFPLDDFTRSSVRSNTAGSSVVGRPQSRIYAHGSIMYPFRKNGFVAEQNGKNSHQNGSVVPFSQSADTVLLPIAEDSSTSLPAVSRPNSIRIQSISEDVESFGKERLDSVRASNISGKHRPHGSTNSATDQVIRETSITLDRDLANNKRSSVAVSSRLRSFLGRSKAKRQEKDSTARSGTVFFSKGRFILRIITEVATLLTFGAVFPPLALIICISMFSYTLFTQLIIGRFLTIARKHRDYGEIRRILESECYGVSTQLIDSFSYLIFFAALFFSIFLFDTLGDVTHSAKRSAWIGILMILMPGILYCLWRVAEGLVDTYERCKKHNARNRTASRSHSRSDSKAFALSGLSKQSKGDIIAAINLDGLYAGGTIQQLGINEQISSHSHLESSVGQHHTEAAVALDEEKGEKYQYKQDYQDSDNKSGDEKGEGGDDDEGEVVHNPILII